MATLGDAVRGTDPAAAREQERQGETMRDLCAAYMDRHGNAKRSGSDDQRRIDRHILPGVERPQGPRDQAAGRGKPA